MDMTKFVRTKNFKYQQVTIFEDQELGRGTFGKVCRALCDELPCATKLLNPILFQFSDGLAEENMKIFNQESKLLCSINHPCIVQYLDAYVHLETCWAVLLMELMDENLTSFLDKAENPLPIYLQIDLCHDVIQGLAYLHSNGIIHRNLTGKNILIYGGTKAKVTDFGMMKMADSQKASNPHLKHSIMPDSSAYMPPETFRNPPSYTYQLDIFSFGVVSLQIMTGHFPHPSSYKVSEIERRKFDLESVEKEHPILPIVMGCLKDRDILRPPAPQLCRKLKQLQDTLLYEESHSKRNKVLQEVDRIRKELKEAQKKNEELKSQLENVGIENKQLYQLITKHSEKTSSNGQLK